MSTFKASLESEQKVLEKNMQEQNSNKQMVVKDIEKLKQMEDALIMKQMTCRARLENFKKQKVLVETTKAGLWLGQYLEEE